MYDIIVIGAGPAGISASIYAKRANMNVAVFYHGTSELEKAHKIDNYYGFENGITGKDLFQKGVNQAKNIGIDIFEKEVIDVKLTEDLLYEIKIPEENFVAKSIIIATGNKKVRPNIKGIQNFEGKGVSYCAICDGFFYKNKNVAVIGNGKFANSEAGDLAYIVNNLVILTNGLEFEDEKKYAVDTRKIKEVKGEGKVSQIEFEDGDILNIDGIFIAEGIAGGSNFAKKLGIQMENDNIKVNESMETNMPGVFACGNLTGGLLQVNKAVYEGAKAGLSAVNYVRNMKEE